MFCGDFDLVLLLTFYCWADCLLVSCLLGDLVCLLDVEVLAYVVCFAGIVDALGMFVVC